MGARNKDSDGGEDMAHPEERRVVYCLIPAELAQQLHEPLRRHFRDIPDVEVVVEHRRRERRRAADRRRAHEGPPAGGERRIVKDEAGRRLGERRALTAPVEPPPLPRRARRHAERIRFVERLEPSGEQAEDVDTARLVARFQAGDTEAFGVLYARYFDRVYSYLRVVLRHREEAEDATQDVFASAFEKLPELELRRPFRAWLLTVVRNRAIDLLRRSGRLQLEDNATIERRREAAASEEEPELPVVGWISDPDLLLFVERLPLPQRQVLVLRYLLDLSAGEAAAILGRTPEDVRALQYRAVKVLRERLASIGRTAPERSEKPAKSRIYAPQAIVLRKRRFSLLKR